MELMVGEFALNQVILTTLLGSDSGTLKTDPKGAKHGSM
jgi:hypothetical protein